MRLKALGALVPVVAAGLVAFASAKAGIFLVDDRVQRARTGIDEYTPIGIVRNTLHGRSKIATATLVDRCHVLTVAHVVDPIQDLKRTDISNYLEFIILGDPATGGELRRQAVPVAPVAHGDWVGQKQGSPEDWLLLKAAVCLGERYGYIQATPAPFVAGRALEAAGYPRDKDPKKGITLDLNCNLRGEGRDEHGGYGPVNELEGLWMHDCSTLGGNSGSPVMHRGTGGELRIGMIHSASLDQNFVMEKYDARFAAAAVPVSGFYHKIAPFIDGVSLQKK